jgi:plasmid stabilization system protein ParE
VRRVRYSSEARLYIKSEATYLRARSGLAALRFLDAIKLLTSNLSSFPALGHLSEETLVHNARRLVVGEYLVDYELTDDEALVLAIRHGRQMPPNQSIDSDDDFEVT